MRVATFAFAAAAEPAGWSPGAVSPPLSTRAPGLLRGGLDAWLGRAEAGAGLPLTPVQVAALAPLLAGAGRMEEGVVRADLERVRVHVGGLAHGAGNVATTIGTNLYVSDARWATHLLSWAGREWLAHELAHTLQWRRMAPAEAGPAARDHAFLNAYLGAFVAHDGSLRAGGLIQAMREWQRRRDAGAPIGSVADLLHDTHPMEREAERIARAVREALDDRASTLRASARSGPARVPAA